MMQTEYLEHANLSVADVEHTIRFLTTALPSWRVRHRGESDWFGTRVRWAHVGTADHYIALYDGGEHQPPHWTENAQIRVKHLGIVVPSLAPLIARLAAAGFALDHLGAEHPHRRSAYFVTGDQLQFEFVEYLSTVDAERNDYRL